jgi:hypothetical protein
LVLSLRLGVVPEELLPLSLVVRHMAAKYAGRLSSFVRCLT